ncbi:MAG TPA: hypothetical protein VFA49_15705 [Chloroflexota bacterium]|jgi:hypothetical protein|nr:hypothetical protein [Chloroflexota bacterium]
MTLPYQDDRGPQPVGSPAEGGEDVLPRGERDQDELRSSITHDLTSGERRPLTDEERAAAERDSPPGARVYAPASERVSKPPVPGHQDLVEHPDTSTPERQSVGGSPRLRWSRRRVRISDDSSRQEEMPLHNQQLLALGVGWLGLFVCGAVGTWLFRRWRAERNTPVNRLRRQARRAATEIRQRVPEATEAPPAMGVSAIALLTTALLVGRWMRGREPDLSDRAKRVRETGWQRQLQAFRDRWTPRNVEL